MNGKGGLAYWEAWVGVISAVVSLLAFLASTHYLHTPEIMLLKLFHLWRHTNVYKARSCEFGLMPKPHGLKSLTVTLWMTWASNWPLCLSISSLKEGVGNYRACFVGLSNGLEGCLLEKPLHAWLMFLNTSFTQNHQLKIYFSLVCCLSHTRCCTLFTPFHA